MPVLEFIIALGSLKTLVLRLPGHKNKSDFFPYKRPSSKADRIKKYYSSLLARKEQLRLISFHLKV